jgi:hypothetical protein
MGKWLKLGTIAAVLALVGLTALGKVALAQGPQLPGVPAASSNGLDAKTAQALTDALNDEYRAHAFYEGFIAKFGAVTPFANIVRAESAHIEAVKSLMVRYGMSVPADTFAGQIKIPATLNEALQAGIDAEKANVAMYDRFTFVKESDIQAVFSQLRNVSQTRHLTAFERALGSGAVHGLGNPGWGRFGQRWSR